MNRRAGCLLLGGAVATLSSCAFPVGLPVETEFALINLSEQWYATIGIRSPDTPGAAREFVQSELVPPWGVFRERFFDLLPETGGCPSRLELRVHLYRRIDENVPVALDPTEAVDPTAVASIEVNVAACERVVASTFSVVLLEADDGTPALRIGEGTAADEVVFFAGRALPDLAEVPARLAAAALAGRVLMPDGTPVGEVGVLLRPPPIVDQPPDCPEFCFGEPIAFTITDSDGNFRFEGRAPGAYQIEPFADELQFRPGFIVIESPIDNLLFFAEPVP